MSIRTIIQLAAVIGLTFAALAAPTWAQTETEPADAPPPPLQRPSMAPT